MKKIINILIIVLLLTTLGNINVYGQDFDNLKTLLLETGVEEPYNSTIINYLKSSAILKEDLIKAIDITRDTINVVNSKGQITEFTLSECCYIYNNITTLCKYMNFKIHVNFISFKFAIIDKLSGDIIFQGDLRRLSEYSIIFETLISNDEFINELII